MKTTHFPISRPQVAKHWVILCQFNKWLQLDHLRDAHRASKKGLTRVRSKSIISQTT